MADQDYTLHYKCDAGDMLAKNHQVVSSLQTVDRLLDQVKAKVGSAYSGAGQSASAAARQANNLANALSNVSTQATSAGTALKGVSASVPKLASGLGSLGGAMIGLTAVHKVFSALAEQSDKIEERWRAMAADIEKFRDNLRELASLKGEDGPNNNVVADVNALALGVGVVPEKAKELAQAYENFGPTVRDKGHYQPGAGTKEKLESDILTMTGRVAKARGLDMKQAGDLAGTMGLFHTFHNTEEAADKLGGALWGISKGTTDYTTGVPALNKAMAKLLDPKEAAAEGALPGRLRSIDEGGVYFGITSLGTGGRADPAAHRMVQISRLLNPDTNTPKGKTAAAALSAAGITPQMDDIEKVVTLGKHLKSLGPNTDAMNWLQDNKLGSAATREGLAAVLKDAGELDARVKQVRKGGFGRQELQRTAAHYRTDRTADAGRIAAVSGVMDKVQGEEAEWHTRALAAAEERRRLLDPNYNSTAGNAAIASTYPLAKIFGGEGAFAYHNEFQKDFGAMPTLRAAAKKAGVDLSQFPDLNARDLPTRARAFGQASEAIKARGVDPLDLGTIETAAERRNEGMRGADFSRGADPNGSELLQATKEQTSEIKGLRGDLQHLGRGNASGGNFPRIPRMEVDAPEVGMCRK